MTLDFARLLERRRTPLTTYRLQLHRAFGFQEAAAIADYLASLGITDCYTSPVLKARPGSTHGYDITDHNALNPELGGEAGYAVFVAALREQELGHLLDFAPNHMGADAGANPWWRDVLENGPSSRYADYFDIDWNPEKAELKNKILLPILDDQYGAVLESGRLKLAFEHGRFSLLAGEAALPIDPQQAPQVLRHGLQDLQRELNGDADLADFLSIVTALDELPRRSDSAPGRPEERRRESEAVRGRLESLSTLSPRIARHLQGAVEYFNGRAGDPRSFDALHGLLESQGYRLSYWKTAADEINYRRFFDINDLVGLKMERDAVFDATHALVLDLLASGRATGLRIDHPDGLFDPSRYFERLQSAFLRAWIGRQLERKGKLTAEESRELDAWRAEEVRKDFKSPAARPLYVVAEKILAPGEPLDPHWRVDGTSGYDFLNDVQRVFVDQRGAAALREVYRSFTGKRISPETVAYASRKTIMAANMASELSVLSDLLNRISEVDRRTRDFTRQSLRRALSEIVACFSVYRTYITDIRATAYDRDMIDMAVARARRRNPATEPSIFEFIRSLMIPKEAAGSDDAAAGQKLRFAMKLQQYTAPVQAKGIEDTAFYRYHVLVSNNEVGSELDRFSETAGQFHDSNRRRAEEQPRSMLATATHDTKRGEDARARIAVLSEIPGRWETAVRRWSRVNASAKSVVDGESAPDANDEYLFYQVLLGAWDFAREGPDDRASLLERLQAYMLKACREAKLKTSWLSPDEEYEKGVRGFVSSALTNRAFLSEFLPFAHRVAALGALSSLSRTVIKISSPGVADFYQGTELWDLNLVDPDNRRPVDYDSRRKMLSSLEPLLSRRGGEAELKELLAHWEDGRVKLFATAKALRYRREHAELFVKGSYAPLEVRGRSAERFIAFRRSFGAEEAIVVAPRLCAGPLWGKGLDAMNTLFRSAVLVPPSGGYRGLKDIFTGSALNEDGDLGTSLSLLPFALFSSRGA